MEDQVENFFRGSHNALFDAPNGYYRVHSSWSLIAACTQSASFQHSLALLISYTYNLLRIL